MPELLDTITQARKMRERCQSCWVSTCTQSFLSSCAKRKSMPLTHHMLKRVLYRADSVNMLHDAEALQRQNRTHKRKQEDAAARLIHGQVQKSLLEMVVLTSALVEHVRSIGILRNGVFLELLPTQRKHRPNNTKEAHAGGCANNKATTGHGNKMHFAVLQSHLRPMTSKTLGWMNFLEAILGT